MATESSPFHSGTLQSGISLAIQQQKLVACFIHGDDDVSELWLRQFKSRRDKQSTSTTGEVIGTKAVLLCLELGSQEVNFLNAFCPIVQAPMLVFIHNGQVLERIDGSVGEDEWYERVEKVTGVVIGGGKSDTPENVNSTSAGLLAAREPSPHQIPSSNAGMPSVPPQPAMPGSASQASPTEPAARPSSEQATPISDLFPNRAQKLEEEKQKREEAEKAERLARQNARRKEAEEAHAMHRGSKAEGVEKEKARRDWIVQQKQRKEEAKQERQRILAQIEADKAERKARAQQAREEAEGVGTSSPMKESSMAAMKRTMGAGGRCDLSVRLFDGSSIRGRFDPHATLGKTVREWIKEETGDAGYDAKRPPFTFRHVLAPRPSRSIDVTEEGQTLAELDMVPTSTLVLVPVAGYQDAYSVGSGGILNQVLYAPYAALLWLWALLSSVLTSLFGSTGPPNREGPLPHDVTEPSTATSSDLDVSGASSRIKVNTLADQRAEAAKKNDRETEFYNGNSLGFEGRKDDDEKKSD